MCNFWYTIGSILFLASTIHYMPNSSCIHPQPTLTAPPGKWSGWFMGTYVQWFDLYIQCFLYNISFFLQTIYSISFIWNLCINYITNKLRKLPFYLAKHSLKTAQVVYCQFSEKSFHEKLLETKDLHYYYVITWTRRTGDIWGWACKLIPHNLSFQDQLFSCPIDWLT